MPSRPEIIIRDNPAQMARAAADIFTKAAKEAVSKGVRFTVAVSGGSTPRAMHGLLETEPFRSEIPWNSTYIFWVDERCVPINDPASNYGAAGKDLLDRVPIPTEQSYPMPVDSPPEEGAMEYQKTLIDFFQLQDGEFPVFDLIFLGIGRDGHTASLFPGQEALDEDERLVVAVKGGNPDVSRITMTFPVLNNAGHVVILVSGRSKAEVLRSIFEDSRAYLPAHGVRPINGRLTWLLDSEVASLFSRKAVHEVV